jgi:hypothetical protein
MSFCVGDLERKCIAGFGLRGMGHLDPIVGQAAYEDVYWRVWEHIKWCLEQVAHENELGECTDGPDTA